MRRVFLTAAIACLLASNAWAGQTCTWVGRYYQCWDSGGQQQTCTWVGRYYQCW